MAKTPYFQCRGPGLISGEGTRFHILQLRVHMPRLEVPRAPSGPVQPNKYFLKKKIYLPWSHLRIEIAFLTSSLGDYGVDHSWTHCGHTTLKLTWWLRVILNLAPCCGFLILGSHPRPGRRHEGARGLGRREQTVSTRMIAIRRKRLAKNSRRSSEDVQTFKTEGGENLSYMNITCIIII